MTTMKIGSGGIAAEPLEVPEMRLPEFVLGQARVRGAKPAIIEADSGREISYARLAGAGVRRDDLHCLRLRSTTC
jgi:hypothetical protein